METPACLHCSKPIPRKPSSKWDRMKFCDRACAGAWRATQRAAHNPTYGCRWCDAKVDQQDALCPTCVALIGLGVRALGELRKEYGAHGAAARIRAHARRVHTAPKVCAACGYSLHVEICHIRPISAFPPEALISEVNAVANLVALDRRCHWELDHGYLTLDI